MSVVFSLNFKKPKIVKLGASFSSDNGLFFKGDNGCAVILVHGLTGTPHEMKFLAAFLNKKGYSVICPRLANHGKPLDVLKNTEWQDFYKSVREAFIEARNNYSVIFAAGLSMGALLVLLLAEEFQNSIMGVSCLSPTLFYDGWNTPWCKYLLPFVYATPLKYYFYFKEDSPYGIKNEALQRLIHRYYKDASLNSMKNVEQRGYPFFPVALLYQLELLVKYISKRLHNIHIPVQLIQAKYDDMTSVKNSQFIYDRIKSDKKELILLDNSYHLIIADQERDKVAQKVEEFFGRMRQ